MNPRSLNVGRCPLHAAEPALHKNLTQGYKKKEDWPVDASIAAILGHCQVHREV
jgi:hypothetical protein